MNSRQYAIIKLLDSAEDEFFTSAQLAAEINVSPKTIRTDIKELNALLQDYRIYIKPVRGRGYVLKAKNRGDFNQLFLDYANKAYSMIPVESGERVNYIIEKLLLCTDYIKMEDLLLELFISRSTLQSDFKIVREILQRYGLSIDHKPNYGMKVSGEETLIRFCISEYIFNQHPLLTEEMWGNILPANELHVIRDSILKNIRKQNIIISDISLQNLIIHLVIAYKRILEDRAVEFVKEEVHSLRDEKEYEVAQTILEEIESVLGIDFPSTEVAYLTIHLKGAKLNPATNILDLHSVVDKEIYFLAKEVTQLIDSEFDLKLTGDEELLRNLCLHLKPAISRYRYQMNIRNPMLEEIKMNYPLSFEVALFGANIINDRLAIQFNECEIGYIALHIEAALEKAKRSEREKKRCLIVCATGLGSSQLLLHKLTNIFGKKLDIVGTTEYYNLKRHQLEDLDFIISTVPIKSKLPVPVICIRAILGDMDISKIEEMMEYSVTDIRDYILPEYTFLQYNFQTKEAAICFLTSNLIKKGQADASYAQSVLDRERFASTSFGNLVAVPHPLQPGTSATFLSLLTLENPIHWGDQIVQLVILLNVNKDKKEDLQPMFQSLVQLMDDKQKVFQILECKTYAQIKETLKR